MSMQEVKVMALSESVSKVLDRILEEYDKERNIGAFTYDRVDKYREICGDMMTGRMNALSNSGEMDSVEYAQCSFLKKTLDNGWTPKDLSFFSKFYENLQSVPEGPDRDKGFALISRLESNTTDSFAAAIRRPGRGTACRLLQNTARTPGVPRRSLCPRSS